MFMSAANPIPLFLIGHLIDRGVEHPFFLHIVGAKNVQQPLLFLIALRILLRHFVMNGFELLSDLTMLPPHHEGRPVFGHASFLFPQGEQQILFLHNVPLQARLKFFKGLFGLGEIRLFQRLKGLEQLVQPVMVLLLKLADGFLPTHDASNSNL
jgi:hypothetical protein